MSIGAQRVVERIPRPKTSPPASGPPAFLRLPEDRAFDVATINDRLARMAERAAPLKSRMS